MSSNQLYDHERRCFTCHSTDKLPTDKYQIPILCAGMEAKITFYADLRPETVQLSSVCVYRRQNTWYVIDPGVFRCFVWDMPGWGAFRSGKVRLLDGIGQKAVRFFIVLDVLKTRWMRSMILSIFCIFFFKKWLLWTFRYHPFLTPKSTI